jgi:hypothetical protein
LGVWNGRQCDRQTFTRVGSGSLVVSLSGLHAELDGRRGSGNLLF